MIQQSEMSHRVCRYGALVCAAFVLMQTTAAPLPPQNAPAVSAQPAAQISPQQLDDLVAPIALYPDPLVGEVLAASTYPMEIAETEQWVRDHTHWKSSKAAPWPYVGRRTRRGDIYIFL